MWTDASGNDFAEVNKAHNESHSNLERVLVDFLSGISLLQIWKIISLCKLLIVNIFFWYTKGKIILEYFLVTSRTTPKLQWMP